MIVQPKQEFFQGTVASRNFDIDLSNDVNFGVAFDIISSGIYKDKPLAIVRELCSNAQDSHSRAGTTRPFTVHVPTTIEPFWSVRDYGTGFWSQQWRGLLRLAGHQRPGLPLATVRLSAKLAASHLDWTQFTFGRLEQHGEIPLFVSLKGDSRLGSMAEAEAVVTIPEGRVSWPAGAIVPAQLLR